METCVKRGVRLWKRHLEWEFADQDRQNEADSEQNSAWDEMMASHGLSWMETGSKLLGRGNDVGSVCREWAWELRISEFMNQRLSEYKISRNKPFVDQSNRSGTSK